MGSFASTCAISGLPIELGDKIRIFLLVESPFTDSRPCGTTGVWAPRTLPLCASYDDYGGAKEVEEGPARDVWLEGLAYDAVPKGWGDNYCHDVPVTKTMTWEQMMDAVLERRLRVRSRVEDLASFQVEAMLGQAIATFGKNILGDAKPASKPKKHTPAGVPTRARVQKIITKAGFQLYGDVPKKARLTSGGYMVNKRRYGEVRVRFQDFGKEEENLAKLLPHLTEYATMICAGEGRYANRADLLVRPKPGTKDYYGGTGREKVKSLAVELAMVREDVWQALLRLHTSAKDTTIEAYYRAIDNHLSGSKEDKLFDQVVGSDALPFVVGQGTHWYLMKKKGPLPREFLRSTAEFAYIQGILAMTRYHWRPAYAIGPQFGEWGLHLRLLSTLVNVVRDRKK
jgi:hypothetical protein